MKPFLFVLLISLSFAQFNEPPLDSIIENNSAAAQALEGHYNSSFARNGTIILTFGNYTQPLNLSASVEIAGLSPSIDNMSCAYDGMALITARGFQQGHLTSLSAEGYPDFTCDAEWFEGNPDLAWRCDFDDDDCAEYENQTFVLYDMNVTFTIGNFSSSIPFSSTFTEIPEDVLGQIRNASGADNLTVNISGNIIFIYEINNRSFGFGDCGSNVSNVSQSINYTVERNFTVGGDKKLFFLRSPILREQWFRNNRFDLVALSQCPLYRAEIYRNGNITRNFTVRGFLVSTDDYGIQSMQSDYPANYSNGSGWSEHSSNVTTPVPLEEYSHSFSYVYEFNHSYDGIGESDLALLVYDSAANSANHSERILSRMLSRDSSVPEAGGALDPNVTRPSVRFERDVLTSVEIGLGLVALVIFLAFVNYWIVR
jgi:hypothetical protein